MALELLSPAGSPEALRAAVQSGCGAVYLGWGNFNARRSAKNFTDEEFAAAIRYCHVRGVRVFLTLNTLLTDRELPLALDAARTACRLGVDSVLVQDWGLFDLLRQALPDLPLHASTQMSVFTSGGVDELYRDGCERVVIARECSGADTAAACRSCPAEIEIFGHGALCMCYSGQCEMSALIGGRSGNRGTCAQPCRLPYGFNAPAKNTYPLSLKDSCLAGRIAEMERMGVSCLKLEGRMKRPEYVAVITDIYSRLIREGRKPTPAEKKDLELAFSRSGFTEDYWQGRRGPAMFGTRPENAPEPKELFAAARTRYEKGDARTVPIHFSCVCQSGQPAALTVWDEDGHAVTVSGVVPEPAQNKALTAADLEARLQKTGGTAFRCADGSAQVEDGLFLSGGKRPAAGCADRAGGRPLRRAGAPGAGFRPPAGRGLRRRSAGTDGLRLRMGAGGSAAAPVPCPHLCSAGAAGRAGHPAGIFRGMVRRLAPCVERSGRIAAPPMAGPRQSVGRHRRAGGEHRPPVPSAGQRAADLRRFRPERIQQPCAELSAAERAGLCLPVL